MLFKEPFKNENNKMVLFSATEPVLLKVRSISEAYTFTASILWHWLLPVDCKVGLTDGSFILLASCTRTQTVERVGHTQVTHSLRGTQTHQTKR